MSTNPKPREKASDIRRAEDEALPREKAPREAPREKAPREKPPRERVPREKAAREKTTGEKTREKKPAGEEATEEAKPPTGGGRGQGGRRRQTRRRPGGQVTTTERVMLVHADPNGTQIAITEAGRAVEHYVTRHEDRSVVGNIYLGRVQNVLPGMEASFVDVGEARNGVLYAGEVGIAGEEGDEVPRIETVLKSGQSILVQVTKDPMRAKGARLTALISIAGRHLVLVPNGGSIGVSRRLPDKERTRLRDIAAELKPGVHGLIIRTAAEGASRRDLERDLERVLETWAEVEGRSKGAKAPALLYEEPELELRVIRDLFNREVVRCIVDDEELESKLRSYVRVTTPDLD
ncbi:MAG: ribonuclease E/G, partial [Actinomycetota bacterium]